MNYDRRRMIAKRTTYMMLGDLDKSFHRPECACERCEQWRKDHDRPTHAELRAMPPEDPPCR